MRLVAFLFCAGSVALAHDLSLRFEVTEPAVIARANYEGAGPVEGADVWIFSPEDGETSFQRGYTDLNGAFSFVPDAPGDWTVRVDDGFGHRAERSTAIDWKRQSAAETQAEGPPWSQALTGVSLIVGIMGISLWWKSRRDRSPRE